LLDEKCPIRHIITVNALKEGWDCPFAYVLATLANRTSIVDVEQILGRILRLPDANRNESDTLNISYVITSSADFHETLQKIVAGLNNAGFSERDYRPAECGDEGLTPHTPMQKHLFQEEDVFPNVDASEVKNRLAENRHDHTGDEAASTGELSAMLEEARRQAEEYEAKIADEEAENVSPGLNPIPLEVREYMKEFPMNAEFAEEATGLRLPQFVVKERLPMFSDGETALLTPERLSQGFSLRGMGTAVNFSSLEAEIAQVDVENESSPKAWKLTGMDNQFFRHFFNSRTPEQRVRHCKEIISDMLSKKFNTINDRDISDYVSRVIDGLDAAHTEELQRSPNSYGMRIKSKIDDMLTLHAEGVFKNWIELGKTQCEPRYAFKKTISPVKFTSMHPKSLYKSEEAMNSLEEEVVMELASFENIKWWHRNMSRTGFNINGYVNAYPDIIALTMKGHILMIEPKGDHLENSESRQKISVGRTWQNRANTSGDVYRYYMVFKTKDLNIDGAVQLGRFLEIVKEL
jgi:type III restriction enzyme